MAEFAREFAADAIAARRRIGELGNRSRFTSGDQSASAAGHAPVPQRPGKTNHLRRATVVDPSAFCAIRTDPLGRAFC